MARRTAELIGRWSYAWIACGLLLFSGCAGTRIPADWPVFAQQDVKDGCGDITGQFNNTPIAAASAEPSQLRHIGSAPGAYRFSEIFKAFAELERVPHEEIKFLSIQRDDKNRLVITARHQETGTSMIKIYLMKTGEDLAQPEGVNSPAYSYTCVDGFTLISRSGWLPLSPFPQVAFMGMMGSSSIRMRKAIDGSLVVRAIKNNYATTPIYPIPIMPCVWCKSDYDDWHRFAPYTERSAAHTTSSKVDATAKGKETERDVSQTRTLQAPNDDYLNCVKRGLGNCDDYVSCFSGGKRQWTNRSKCD